MPTAEGFDGVFAALAQSPTIRRIWREAYGDEYPEDAQPFGFITLSMLQRIAREVHVEPGHTLADLACGSGGPGLWVARATGARLVGIDYSSIAVRQARQRAAAFGLSNKADFLVSEITAIPLPDASLDAALSVDAFQFFPDQPAALREIARIVRPGARLVLTTWDASYPRAQGTRHSSQYQTMLQEAGFALESYESIPGWEKMQGAVYTGMLAAQESLTIELGETVASKLFFEAREFPARVAERRRVLIVARKSTA
ncbi:MAG TPA: class I SAM-dependent methyltransferase [Ktedonobacterales bacterium]|nr:class I SAM-dependent methyltransferase [Ktedonobacterales bacterium]